MQRKIDGETGKAKVQSHDESKIRFGREEDREPVEFERICGYTLAVYTFKAPYPHLPGTCEL